MAVMQYICLSGLFNTMNKPLCPGCLVGNFAAEVAESSPMCRAVLRDSAMNELAHAAGCN